MDCNIQFTGETAMKTLMHFVQKHEDIAETLSGIFVMLATGGIVLGLAPFIMYLQLSAH